MVFRIPRNYILVRMVTEDVGEVVVLPFWEKEKVVVKLVVLSAMPLMAMVEVVLPPLVLLPPVLLGS